MSKDERDCDIDLPMEVDISIGSFELGNIRIGRIAQTDPMTPDTIASYITRTHIDLKKGATPYAAAFDHRFGDGALVLTQKAIAALIENNPELGRYPQVRNRSKCAQCGDIIESLHRHDFVRCMCGAISVDGGNAYHKKGGDPENFLTVPEDEPTPTETKEEEDNGGRNEEDEDTSEAGA